jgi:hypothetical protein
MTTDRMTMMRAACRTLKEHRHAGVCENGHLLIEPGAIVNQTGYKLCRACRESWLAAHSTGPRMCRNKLHQLADDERRCGQCAAAARQRTTAAQSLVKGYTYKRSKWPPDAVLNGAVCSPAKAKLFDPVGYSVEPDEPPGNDWNGVARAQAICADCPVRALCFADAVENRRFGVWGGVYLSPKFYEKRRSEAVVQNVKSPVECSS